MVTVMDQPEADQPDPNRARFVQLLKQGVRVARQQVQAEGAEAPLADDSRQRALNILSYAFDCSAAWAEANTLLLVMAAKMEMAGYREEWLRYLETGLQRSEQLEDRPTEAALAFYSGQLQRLLNRYDEADQLLQRSATLCAALGDKPGEARALNQLAYLAWQQNHYEAAFAAAERALCLLDEADPERAMSLSAMGLVAFRKRQWQAAENYHRQALAIRVSSAQQRAVAWSLQNLADALCGQKAYETAAAYFKEAIALLTKIKDPVNCAVTQMNLGIVYQQQGEIKQALALYAGAEMTFRQFNDRLNLAKTLVNQGVGYLTLREWQQAETVCAESAHLFQQLKNQGDYLNALDGVGISYLERAEYAKALTIFELIAAQLPEIEGNYFYQGLSAIIPGQLARARSGIDQS